MRKPQILLLAVMVLSLASTASAVDYTFEHFVGSNGGFGFYDGRGALARFVRPSGIAADSGGNLYVADWQNHTIRKVTPLGEVTTLAGLADHPGSSDGTGADARFNLPTGIAVDGVGNVYVADGMNHTIRKVTPDGVVTTIAGLAGVQGSDDGTGSVARFRYPNAIAIAPDGDLYVADTNNATIRRVTVDGAVFTLAGLALSDGWSDGTGSEARFYSPQGIAVDATGNIWVADSGNNTIRMVTPGGVVTTIAGAPQQWGSNDGVGSDARFYLPSGIEFDANGDLLVADLVNNTIRKVTPAGVVTTIVGVSPWVDPSGGDDGAGSAARFSQPNDVAVDAAGNAYVTDSAACTIRKISTAGAVTTLAGAPATWSQHVDAAGTNARFDSPHGIVVASTGDAFVSDYGSHTIRKVTPSGLVTTFAGTPFAYGTADGSGPAARFYDPAGLAIDSNSNIYVAESGNNSIRKISPSGVVTRFAGMPGTAGIEDGTGTSARFWMPDGIAIDGSGNLYVADSENDTIRKITPDAVVTTIAGLARNPGTADGAGTNARFDHPAGIAIDANGNLFVADQSNHTIRKITPYAIVSTFAGLAGVSGSADGTGSDARFSSPTGVAIDSQGNLFVADSDNEMIRRITPSGVVTTVGGVAGLVGTGDGTASVARFAFPRAMAFGANDTLFVGTFSSIHRGHSTDLQDIAMVSPAEVSVNSSATLGTNPQTASSHSWRVIRRPADSFARLSSETETSPTLTPDRPGLYTFLLRAAGSAGTRYSTVDLLVTGTMNPPIIAAVSPDDGDSNPPPLVTLTGSNFSTPSVLFAGLDAPIVSSSATSITVQPPQLGPGTLSDVAVANANGDLTTIPERWFVDYSDVSSTNPLKRFVEALSHVHITSGCGGGNYCPGSTVTRAQMAVFLMMAKHGRNGSSGPSAGNVFVDVPADAFAAASIEQLYREEITYGCATTPLLYCPSSNVSRAQMAVFLLKAFQGNLNPPAASGIFADVDVASPYARWIEELYRRGITGGCSTNPLRYCPNDPVTRAQMAVFMATLWDLPRDPQ